MELLVVPLHKYPEYMFDCCNIINDEWKRSDTARLHSLQSSRDNLPTSLILLKDTKVIGHLKLTSIPSIKAACFVESVVIIKQMRGKGYGTRLMKKAEEYCKDVLCLNTIYLSTKGQEEFYEKLAYVECEPISIYGNYIPKTNETVIVELRTETMKMPNVHQVKAPPAPPLPMYNKNSERRKTYMMKKI